MGAAASPVDTAIVPDGRPNGASIVLVGRAIRCAALRDEPAGIDLQIRAGLHTGEVELRGDDVGGIAVHITARVMAATAPGEILTSSTVRDLVVGSDIAMTDRGPHPLKGVDGTWQLFAASP